MALRNGTIGWTLAGQALDHGRAAPLPRADRAARGGRAQAARARFLSRRRRAASIARALEPGAARPRAHLYCFDVRTPEELPQATCRASVSAPGGQLVQETDVFAPVRGARIVLADDRGVRADMTASWLAQMGWDVYVLDGGFDGAFATGPWTPRRPELPSVRTLGPTELAARVGGGGGDPDRPGAEPVHRRGHIPGAWFVVRSRLAEALGELRAASPFVSPRRTERWRISPPPTWLSSTGRAPLVLAGGTEAWTASGWPLESGLQRPASPTEDVYRRPYEGTDNAAEAMQAYLDWEFGLVEQLRRDATHGFHVI